MKRFLLCLSAVVFSLACLFVSALAEDDDDVVLAIPEGVTVIGEEAFQGLSTVQFVDLPGTVLEIGDRAFAGMETLYEITVPESVRSVGNGIVDGATDAVLMIAPYGSTAHRWAVQNRIDYDADTVCRALLISQTYEGSDAFYEDEWLKGPSNDVRNMKGCLEAFSRTTYEVTIRTNRTCEELDQDILSTFSGAKDSDISLFYYSGHGDEGGILVDYNDEDYPATRLRAMLDQIPGRKIVIVDACYSGGLIEDDGEVYSAGAKDPKDFTSAFMSAFSGGLTSRSVFNPSSYFVMTAASSDGLSWEGTISDGKLSNTMGMFTYYLCLGCGWNGLTEKIDKLLADTDGDGVVSFQEAWTYARVRSSRAALDGGQSQYAQVYPTGVTWFSPFRD
ncbi:MAG: caspase family protein [Clostridia bacterium]|nr:caspase family protein [Clostridia bacterium]